MAIESVRIEVNTEEVLNASRDSIVKALYTVGGMAESYAVMNITEVGAVDTGALRNSITGEIVDEDEQTVYIGSDLEYAPYIEFGTGIYSEVGGRQTPWCYQREDGSWVTTHGMEARPFLRPAIADHIDEYAQVIEDILKGG